MKKMRILFIALFMFLFCGLTAASAETMLLEYDGGTHEYNGDVYALVVNNKLLDPPLSPIIFNDRALVPVREIFEEVGATVNYIGDTQTIEIVGDDAYIRLRINDNTAYINGERVSIPDNVVPKLISEVGGETKTMVPVRFISETIGLEVDFDEYCGVILVDSSDYSLSDIYQAPSIDEVVATAPMEYENAEPTAEPASAPVPLIKNVSYDIESDNEVRVTVSADTEFTSYSDFVLTSPERVVVDIPGMRQSAINDVMDINASGVTSIRLGDNDERARIVVDVESLDSYNIEKTAGNVLIIDVKTKSAAATPTPTVKPSVSNKNTAASAQTKLIALDAGHGGSDSGAVGYLNGNAVLEKTLTLQITNRVKTILEDAGYTVSMTRTDDTLPSLTERPAQANEENAAVFVSIHINAADAAEANGTEVWYSEENNGDSYGTTSEQLATNILNRMLYYLGSANRGVKTANHAVTRRCNMPAALTEVGFITNAEEVYKMTTEEYQKKAAQGIAEGIMITLRDVTVPEN